MAFDLATAKERLGITGSDQDDEIQRALDISQAIVEKYLDRKLDKDTQTDTFFNVTYQSVQVSRYPVESVTSITDNIPAQLDLESGVIHFVSTAIKDKIEIVYDGGYDVLPPDLEEAMWQVFDYIWLKVDNPGGSVAAGAIQRMTIPDVGTIQYASTGEGMDGPFVGVAYMLDPYRRLMC